MGHKKIIYKFWIKELMNDSYESLIKRKELPKTICLQAISVLQAMFSIRFLLRPDAQKHIR